MRGTVGLHRHVDFALTLFAGYAGLDHSITKVVQILQLTPVCHCNFTCY